jgi:hypothetical protein
MLISGLEDNSDLTELFVNFKAKPYYFATTIYKKNRLSKLSFDPISKNLRFLSTSVALNWTVGKSTKFSNRARNGEEKFVRDEYGWGSWYPWIYARWNSDHISNLDAWHLFFSSFTHGRIESIKTYYKLETHLAAELKYFLPFKINALQEVFQISQHSRSEINSHFFTTWPTGSVIGLHLRRGEIMSQDESWIRPGTSAFSIDDHVKGVLRMSERLNTDQVYVATDSTNTLELLRKKLPNFNIFSSNTDRSKFYRIEHEKIYDMQHFIFDNPKLGEFYAYSSISDLKYLSQCQGLVGKFSSEFMLTAWLLALGNQQEYVPFVDLHGDVTKLIHDRVIYT